MSNYRIKGTGDIREVYDGGTLVGTIKRKQRAEVAWSITPTRATARKRTVTWWIAYRPDGTAVRWRDGRRLCRDYMKDWKKPDNWHGSRVEPWEAP